MTNTDAERVSDIAKPDDIPQDVWDAASAVVGAPDGLGYAKVFTDRVARAIIEAQSKALAEVMVNSVMLEEISDALNVAVANTKRATERAQKAEAALAEAREQASPAKTDLSDTIAWLRSDAERAAERTGCKREATHQWLAAEELSRLPVMKEALNIATMAFMDIASFNPSESSRPAFEAIAIHARSTVLEALPHLRSIGATPTPENPNV